MRRKVVWVVASVLALACGGKTNEAGSGSQAPNGNVHGAAGSAGAGGNDYRPPFGDGCFGKGTRIATGSGSVAIEDVRVGDLVQGFDLSARAVVEKPVTAVFVHASQPLGLLHTALGSLRITANHPVYDATRDSFVPAGSLSEPFASLELASNWSTAPATLGGFESSARIETVYNLTVADVHTYFANGVLVHNKSRCGYPGDPGDCPCIGDECNGFITPATGGVAGGGASGAGSGTSGGGGMSGGGGTSGGGGMSGGAGAGGPFAGGAPSSADAGAGGTSGEPDAGGAGG